MKALIKSTDTFCVLLCDLSLSLLSKYRFFTTNKSDSNLGFFQQRSTRYLLCVKKVKRDLNVSYLSTLFCCFKSRAIFFSDDFKPFLLPLKQNPSLSWLPSVMIITFLHDDVDDFFFFFFGVLLDMQSWSFYWGKISNWSFRVFFIEENDLIQNFK